jgi:hypothetical protein
MRTLIFKECPISLCKKKLNCLEANFLQDFSIGHFVPGTLDVLRKLVRVEGVSALYTGAVPVLLR